MAKGKKGAVELVAMKCFDCDRRNYTTRKNRRNMQGRIALKKYCKWCGQATEHRETKIK